LGWVDLRASQEIRYMGATTGKDDIGRHVGNRCRGPPIKCKLCATAAVGQVVLKPTADQNGHPIVHTSRTQQVALASSDDVRPVLVQTQFRSNCHRICLESRQKLWSLPEFKNGGF